MKKKYLIGLALVILLLGVVSCAGAEQTPPMPPSEGVVPGAPPTVGAPAPAPQSSSRSGFSDAVVPSVAQDRLIVRTGNMSLVVEDVVVARDEIASIAIGMGGWVVSSQVSGQEQNIRGSIAVRVPDDKFDDSMAAFRNLSERVNSENTDSQDVTEQYTDLQSRLKNAEATEEQYLAILDKAENIEDILRIYDSLTNIRFQIEQIKGQIQYLERTTEMSLISIFLEPVASTRPLVRAGWSIAETFKSAIRGLVVVGQTAGSVLVWIVVLSPVWVALLGIGYWLWRRYKKLLSGG